MSMVMICLIWSIYGFVSFGQSRIRAESMSPPRVVFDGSFLRPGEFNFSELIGEVIPFPSRMNEADHIKSGKAKNNDSTENSLDWRDFIWKVTLWSIAWPRLGLFLLGGILLVLEVRRLRPSLSKTEYLRFRTQLLDQGKLVAGKTTQTDYRQNVSDETETVRNQPPEIPQAIVTRDPRMIAIQFQYMPSESAWELLKTQSPCELLKLNYDRDPQLKKLAVELSGTSADAIKRSTVLILVSALNTPDRGFHAACRKIRGLCDANGLTKLKLLVAQSNELLDDNDPSYSSTRFEDWSRNAGENGYLKKDVLISDIESHFTNEKIKSIGQFLCGENPSQATENVVIANKFRLAISSTRDLVLRSADRHAEWEPVMEDLFEQLNKLYDGETKVLNGRFAQVVSQVESYKKDRLQPLVEKGLGRMAELTDHAKVCSQFQELWKSIPTKSLLGGAGLGLASGLVGVGALVPVAGVSLFALAPYLVIGNTVMGGATPLLGKVVWKLIENKWSSADSSDEAIVSESSWQMSLDDFLRLSVSRIILLELQGNDAETLADELQRLLPMVEFGAIGDGVAEALTVIDKLEVILVAQWAKYEAGGLK